MKGLKLKDTIKLAIMTYKHGRCKHTNSGLGITLP